MVKGGISQRETDQNGESVRLPVDPVVAGSSPVALADAFRCGPVRISAGSLPFTDLRVRRLIERNCLSGARRCQLMFFGASCHYARPDMIIRFSAVGSVPAAAWPRAGPPRPGRARRATASGVQVAAAVVSVRLSVEPYRCPRAWTSEPRLIGRRLPPSRRQYSGQMCRTARACLTHVRSSRFVHDVTIDHRISSANSPAIMAPAGPRSRKKLSAMFMAPLDHSHVPKRTM